MNNRTRNIGMVEEITDLMFTDEKDTQGVSQGDT